MKRRFFYTLILLTLAVSPSYAGQVNYVINGVFSNDVPVTPILSPNEPFQISFSVATPVSPDFVFSEGFEVDEQITFISGNVNTMFDAYVTYYYDWVGGIVDIVFSDGSDDYDFSLGGDQIFTGDAHAPTLLLGTFPITGSVLYYNNVVVPGALPGTVVASDTVPEPGTLTLMATMLLAGAIRVGRGRSN